MLLKHLYDYAISRNLLDDLAFAPKAVRWIIDLDAGGKFLGIVQTTAGDDDKRGKEFSCPQTTRPKTAGGVSEFLADGLTAVFGLEGKMEEVEELEKKASGTGKEAEKARKKLEDRKQNNADKKTDFWRQIKEAALAINHVGLSSLTSFGGSLTQDFLDSILQYASKNNAKAAWWLRVSSGEEKKLGPENFTFRVNGELLLENEDIRQWWREQSKAERKETSNDLPKGLCLVTGSEDQPIALTHNPKIKGVPNTQSFGAAIVSFDKPAFRSYNFDQSRNAPTSEEAATAYCVALNSLLDSKDTSLRLGPTALCFWAVQDKKAGIRFSKLLDKPDPLTVRNFLTSPWAGVERELAKKDNFLAVTLVGNSGRVVVRHWLQETLEQATINFQKWFEDLRIFVPEKPRQKSPEKPKKEEKKTEYNPLSVYWLSTTTVRDPKDLRSDIPAQLYRAAFEGAAPSKALIKPILDQLASRLVRDENYNLIHDESRFSLLKLIINRNRKETDMEIQPTLTADTPDAAYNCGRLLSVLSETQKAAQGYPKGFTGIAERYFGTASASPATVLPLLLRLNRHHLNKIRKGGGSGYQEVVIRDILAKFKQREGNLPPVFPRNLDLQAQGRFALGFYQQQADDTVERSANSAAKKARDEAKAAGKSREEIEAAGGEAYKKIRGHEKTSAAPASGDDPTTAGE
ncbi:MAG: type I-C CRISPR-associated protein Cas8c/Csd1 [Puniceicoccales bacterium]|jgi:CRISPR-associated protein Csd1|nr:type I-C CRISPR-associated protein Cas8c/Csd1 [Puniceicoccales bacterium]